MDDIQRRGAGFSPPMWPSKGIPCSARITRMQPRITKIGSRLYILSGARVNYEIMYEINVLRTKLLPEKKTMT